MIIVFNQVTLRLRKFNMNIQNQLIFKNSPSIFGLQESKNKTKYNKYHEYPLKYIADSNNYGMALKPIIGSTISALSWVPSVGYAYCAVMHEYNKSKNCGSNENAVKNELVFQLVGNLFGPLLIVELTQYAIKKLINSKFRELNAKESAFLTVLGSILALISTSKSIDYCSSKLADKFVD